MKKVCKLKIVIIIWFAVCCTVFFSELIFNFFVLFQKEQDKGLLITSSGS